MPGQLDPDLRKDLLNALLALPAIDDRSTRDQLLVNIPIAVRQSMSRSNASRTDISLTIDQLDRLGRIEATGARPLIVLVETAIESVEGTSAAIRLKRLIAALEEHYGGEPQMASPDIQLVPVRSIEIPEAVILGGGRVGHAFIEGALRAAESVARLYVPVIVDGEAKEGHASYGTGWLIAPDLLITSHHVLSARDRESGDEPATPDDLRAQARRTVAWFDYQSENGPHVRVDCSELVHADAELDFALLCLPNATSRAPLRVIKSRPTLEKGAHLNIIQCSNGGPLLYAIRNNFYEDKGSNDHLLLYLTDTETGASGAPVLNDGWQVIAIHQARVTISKKTRTSEVWRGNQGVNIHAILDSLPPSIRAVIARAQ